MSMLSVVRMWSLASSRAQIQGKARGAEKDFIGDHLPPSKDLDDRPPLTSRTGSGNALYMYLYSCDHTNTLHCNVCQSTGQCGRQN